MTGILSYASGQTLNRDSSALQKDRNMHELPLNSQQNMTNSLNFKVSQSEPCQYFSFLISGSLHTVEQEGCNGKDTNCAHFLLCGQDVSKLQIYVTRSQETISGMQSCGHTLECSLATPKGNQQTNLPKVERRTGNKDTIYNTFTCMILWA